MRIFLAQSFGLCFGVRDAIAQAERLASQEPLTILGELVHNPIVRERLHRQGIAEGSLDNRRSASRRVMITAHGASDRKRTEWGAAGFEIADATCPLVQHAHEQLKRLVAAGFFPVVIGQPGHVEVNGLIEDFPDGVVVSGHEDVAGLPQQQRYGIISQTTQPIDFVRGIVGLIRQAHPRAEVRFVDTVCKPTKERQSALEELITNTDGIVVVGGRTSNNTRQLVETCRAAGKKAFHVERPDDLRPEWFAGIRTVGLTGGTSTLPETVRAVEERLKEISHLLNSNLRNKPST